MASTIELDPVALAIQQLQAFGNTKINDELFNDAINNAIHCCPVNRNKKGLNLNELLQYKCDQTL